MKIQKPLTDNDKEFTDRLYASREREPSGYMSLIGCAKPGHGH